METLVVFLGHRIDKEGLHATADKVEAKVSCSSLKCAKELHYFLVCISYYRNFFPQFGLRAKTSELTASANMLLEMDSRMH